jgi:hypothetical protein
MSETVLKQADERVIAGCVDQMTQVQHQIWMLHRYAEQEVACDAGFRGVFAVLRPALVELTAATREVADRFAADYGAVIGAVEQSARALRGCDEQIDVELRRLAARMDAPR